MAVVTIVQRDDSGVGIICDESTFVSSQQLPPFLATPPRYSSTAPRHRH